MLISILLVIECEEQSIKIEIAEVIWTIKHRHSWVSHVDLRHSDLIFRILCSLIPWLRDVPVRCFQQIENISLSIEVGWWGVWWVCLILHEVVSLDIWSLIAVSEWSLGLRLTWCNYWSWLRHKLCERIRSWKQELWDLLCLLRLNLFNLLYSF